MVCRYPMKSILRSIVVAILTWEAKLVLKKYQPKIVAVTGSVGKTSTKDAIYTLLASRSFVRKSEKSFNSELGVPLTIMGLPTAWSSMVGWLENIAEGLHLLLTHTEYPQWLVLEVGADRPGDIKRLAWLKPQIVVFTRFPDIPVHVEYFESPEQVVAEKRSLKDALRPGGMLIVNHDDPKMREETVSEGQRLLSYGFEDGAAVQGTEYAIEYEEGRPVGASCTVHFQNTTERLVLRGALGRHYLYPLLAAVAVGLSEGMAFDKAVGSLAAHMPPPGRMRLLEGQNHSTIIDDTYNASPVAVDAGLDTVMAVATRGRKIVVLGDMLELGEFSVDEHRKIGTKVASIANVLITVGVRMLAAAEAAQLVKGGLARIDALKESTEAGALLREIVQEGDVVFVKGSQSTRMERAIEPILLDPASAVNVLVRQDEEWKKR